MHGTIKGLFLLSLAALLTHPPQTCSQQNLYRSFRSQNAAMSEVQPAWMAPLIQSDPRLGQILKLSVSNAQAPGARIISYGNNHGLSLLAGRRFQFDLVPPSYFRNHSAALPDGFGNATTQIKYRIVSGDAEHGDYIVTAAVARAFGGGYQQNALLTAYFCPKIAAGKAFGRFNVQTTLNAVLPTAKTTQQGRIVEWNTTAQVHTTAHSWFDVENNSAFFYGGPADGQTQNFLTPAAFYSLRRRSWEPTHASLVFATGMQIATSHFHCYNHNLITEMRILF